MDLSCIISSGDLELYVLGMLSDEEVKQVEQLIVLFPQVREEVDRIAATIGALADESAIRPSPSAREELFKKFSELSLEESGQSQSASASKTIANNRSGRVISIGNKPPQFLNIAAILLVVLAASFLIYLVGDNKKKNQTIIALERSLQNRNRDLIKKQQQSNTYSELISLLLDENFRQIKLENLPGKPKATVDIFWHRTTNELLLVDLSLPAVPPGKQYQLWAIVDGQPVNAGMLEEKKLVAQKMHAFEKADAFAITLEKAGGSKTPTLQEMFVLGKVS